MAAVTLELVAAQRHRPAFAKLEALGLPGNKTEQYRHFAIKPLLAREYTLRIPEETVAEKGKDLVIENDVVTEIPEGVDVSIAEPFDPDESYGDALYFFSHLAAEKAVCLEIKHDCRFEIRHRFDRPGSLLPFRLCVSVAPDVRAQIFETFETSGSEASLMLCGVDARLGENATLHWIRSQSGTDKECAVVGTHRFDVARQAALKLRTFDFGTARGLHQYKIDLGEHAWCDAGHLLLAAGDSRRGNVVRINHDAPYAKSAQEARSILRDRATGIFDGRIKVGHNARYAGAHQNSKAVLLDAHAFMYAKPQLEIYTDELEASHGSTTGELDENALFYLRSRGIAEEEAKKMLVLAFAEVLIDNVGDGEISERVRAEFEAAYFG